MSDPTVSWTRPAHDDPEPPPERRVKVGHLVTGLVFLGLAGGWALHSGGALGDVTVGLVIPVVLVLAGMVGLVVSLVGNRRRARAATRGPAYDTDDTYTYDEPTDGPTDGPVIEPTAPLTGLGTQHDDTKEQ